MTAMDFLPSDLEHMNTNFLDMIENDVNSQLLDIDNITSEKLNEFLNGDLLQSDGSLSAYDLEKEDMTNSNWYQDLQWNDSSKVPQSLIDASNEVENNNPNLLVNPQSVLPMHSTIQTTQQMNQLNSRNGIAVKINGQDAVLTPTQHPQIQYVTVQNVGTNTLNNSQIGYVMCQPQSVRSLSSPSQSSPVLVEHLQNGIHSAHVLNNNNKINVHHKKPEKVYPKPVYSYSCLIAMALKNSKTGNLPVSEIYNFMTDNFPYFKTAPDGWKNSVRHNLSLNKCFAKVESSKPGTGSHTRKGCLWALNPAKIEKMEEEIVKWRKKDPESVKLSMSKPENLELIEQGKAVPPRDLSEPSTTIKEFRVDRTREGGATQRLVRTFHAHKENLELIEQGKAGPPRDSSEPSTPIKAEPLRPMTPIKQEGPTTGLTVSQIIQSARNQSNSQTTNQKVAIKRVPSSIVVKKEPQFEIINVRSVRENNSFDPTLSDTTQNALWDDELTIGIGNTTTQSPLTSPTMPGNNMMFHGNVTYMTNPLLSNNTTPTKTYQNTPNKIYPQTPTRVILA